MNKLIYLIFFYFMSIASLNAAIDINSLYSSLNQLKRSAKKDTNLINKYLEIGNYYLVPDINKACLYADTALTLSISKEFNSGIIRAEILRANYFNDMSNDDSVIEIANRIITLAKSEKHHSGLIAGYTILGSNATKSGHYDKALDYYMKGLYIAEKYPNLRFLAASLYQNMASVYQWKQNYSMALAYCFKAKKQCEIDENYPAVGNVVSVIGAIYMNMNKIDSALKYVNLSIEYAKKYNIQQTYQVAMNNLMVIYGQQGNLKKMIEIANEMLKTANQPDIISSINCNLSSAYYEMKDYKNAHKAIQIVLDTSYAYNIAEDRLFAYAMISDIYEAEGKFALALKYYKKYNALNDSIKNQASLNKISELTIQYDSEKQKQSIKLMKEEAKYEAKIKYNLTYSILALLMMLGLTAYFFIRKKKLAQELLSTNQNLQLANDEINTQKVKLESANITLEKLNQDKNEFLGIAAHDLKNPLSNISMIAFTIKSYYDKLEKDKLMKMIDNIDVTSKRMTEIIVNLLDVNAIDSGRIHFDIKEIVSNEIVNEVVEANKDIAGNKGITLLTQITEPSPVINYDERTLREILENLLSNAIKFSPKNSSISIISKLDEQEGLKITIKDSGPGINENDKQKLFSKYQKLSAKPTGGENSTGLGLSIAKKLAEMLDSSVVCESEYGNGSEFTLAIPNQRIVKK